MSAPNVGEQELRQRVADGEQPRLWEVRGLLAEIDQLRALVSTYVDIVKAARTARQLVDKQAEDAPLWLGKVNVQYVRMALRVLHDAVEQIPLAALDKDTAA